MLQVSRCRNQSSSFLLGTAAHQTARSPATRFSIITLTIMCTMKPKEFLTQLIGLHLQVEPSDGKVQFCRAQELKCPQSNSLTKVQHSLLCEIQLHLKVRCPHICINFVWLHGPVYIPLYFTTCIFAGYLWCAGEGPSKAQELSVTSERLFFVTELSSIYEEVVKQKNRKMHLL